jgi:DNA-binding CsgD family transcriptional regulator
VSAERPASGSETQILTALRELAADLRERLPARAAEVPDDATQPESAARQLVDLVLSAVERPGPGALRDPSLVVRALSIERDLARHTDAQRLRRRARAEDGVERLRAIGDPDELLRRAAEEALEACDVERALLSRIEGETWTAVAWAGEHARDVAGLPSLPLSVMTTEHEVAETRRPFLVDVDRRSGRTHRVLREALAPTRVVVPIVPSGVTIGLLHLDRPGDARSMDLHDRDLAWWFAQGFGRLYERAVVRRRLEAQRALVEDTARAALNAVPVLGEAIDLPHDDAATPRHRHPLEDRPSGDALLTPREREVADLLATGLSNHDIAQRLVIEPATTRSHMRNILRKLGARNRAQAVAIHLRRRTIAPEDAGPT